MPVAAAPPRRPVRIKPALGRAAAQMKRHRRAISIGISLLALTGFVVFVVPQIRGLGGALNRLRTADPAWIGVAVALEATSLVGYGLLFRTVFGCHGVRIGWRPAYQITLAGTVASKLLSTAGAGGVALTVWALRASGLGPREIARRMLAFEILLYSVFAAALAVGGGGLRAGVLPGEAPWALTVVPAIIGAGALAVTLTLSRIGRAPAALREAVGIAIGLVRRHPLAPLGAIAYWTFDIGTLWAAMHAFGTPPPFTPIVMSYFLGQLGNVLPLPGGIGGVEGGTIGALIAFGTPGGLAVLGVLAYRLISFWLPTAPGAIAYLRLRRTVSRWRAQADTGAGTSSASGDERDVTLGVGDRGAIRDMADIARGGTATDGIR